MMNIAIYQINMERDEERLAFRSFDSLGFEDEPAELNSKGNTAQTRTKDSKAFTFVI